MNKFINECTVDKNKRKLDTRRLFLFPLKATNIVYYLWHAFVMSRVREIFNDIFFLPEKQLVEELEKDANRSLLYQLEIYFLMIS